MTPTCCAYGCLNKFEKGSGLGFYRFPSLKSRRILWTLALRRKHFVPNKHTRICGAHFVTGKPSKNKNNVDYIPTLFKFKHPRYESKRFRKVLCDRDEMPDIDAIIESNDESDIATYEYDHEPEPKIKIESEINSPSEIKIEDVQSILEDDIYNPWHENVKSSSQTNEPMAYTFLDIEGNVIARFVKKHVTTEPAHHVKKPAHRIKKPRPKPVNNPDAVQLVFEDNVARIVFDE